MNDNKNKDAVSMKPVELSVVRTPFVERAGLKSLDELLILTEKDIEEMTSQYPKASAQLVMDLFSEILSLRTKNETQKRTLESLREDRDVTIV